MVHASWLLVLLAVLATARLTTLVNDDYLTEPLRAWADRRDLARGGKWTYVAYLLGCPWCVSAYTGLGVAAATYAWHRYWPVQVLLIALAASQLTGLLAVARNAVEDDDS